MYGKILCGGLLTLMLPSGLILTLDFVPVGGGVSRVVIWLIRDGVPGFALIDSVDGLVDDTELP